MEQSEATNGVKEPEKKKIAVPTQKSFAFNTLFTSQEKIDLKINKWLESMARRKQIPMLGKVTMAPGLFGKKIVFVFLYSTFFEIVQKSGEGTHNTSGAGGAKIIQSKP